MRIYDVILNSVLCTQLIDVSGWVELLAFYNKNGVVKSACPDAFVKIAQNVAQAVFCQYQ
jgi:hypothetical protein